MGSDHRILSVNLKISLRTKKRLPHSHAKYNTDRLKHEETKKKFELELFNRFEDLQKADANTSEIQIHYNNLEAANATACKTVLGIIKRTKFPNWVSERTNNLFLELEKARRKYRQRKTNHLRKRWVEAEERLSESNARDERARLEKELTELEKSSRCNNLKRTWQLVNKLSGKGEKKKPAKVKKLNGEDPATQEELLKDWATYFESLLNGQIASSSHPRHLEPIYPYVLKISNSAKSTKQSSIYMTTSLLAQTAL